MRQVLVAMFTVVLGVISADAWSASCSASNDAGDSCSIDCAVGQSAACSNATGASSPTCECKGDPSGLTFLKLGSGVKALSSSEKLETDVVSVVNAKLATLPAAHLRNSCRQVENGQACRERRYRCVLGGASTSSVVRDPIREPMIDWCYESICHPTYATVCDPVMGSLSSTGQFTVEVAPKVQVQEPNWNDVPIGYFGLRAKYRNCNPEKQTMEFSHVRRFTVGSKLSKTKTIKSNQEISASVGFEFVVKGNVAAKFNKEISLGSAEETSEQREETFTYREVVNIPPMHYVEYRHEFGQKSVDILYSGVVQLDGPLEANMAGVQLLSQALTKPDDRVFEFAGVVSDAQVYDALTDNRATKLSEAECKKEGSYDGPVLESYMR